MEPKKEQIVRKMLDRVHAFAQKWWPVAILFCTVALWVAVVALTLTSCRSTTEAYGTQHTIRDSVIYTYKTLLRDSIRIKDSTVVSFSTVQRDSVVLRVDSQTGNVAGKDTWHWRDTNRDRDHVVSVGRMVSKADSVASERVKKDSLAIISKAKDKAAQSKNEASKRQSKTKSHFWLHYILGILSVIIPWLAWRYRKTIIRILKSTL